MSTRSRPGMDTPDAPAGGSEGTRLAAKPLGFSELGQLRTVMATDAQGAWRFRPARALRAPNGRPLQRPPTLDGYFFEESEELACVEHNRRWARGEESRPRFLFAYINLPTSCSLRCQGCYQGIDRSPRRLVPWKETWLHRRLDEILDFLREHGGRSVAYAGVGELMTDPGALDLVERIRARGLGFVMFTNGQALCDQSVVDRLDELGVTLILSLRDTYEVLHDARTGRRGSFRRTVTALAHCLRGRFSARQRLAVEMPVLRDNRDRALSLLAACRHLGVTPLIESFVVLGRRPDEIAQALTFAETDAFFGDASGLDRSLGYDTRTGWGQRIVGRPPCRRPKFTFTVSEDGRVVGCPACPDPLGSLSDETLAEVWSGQPAREHVGAPGLCPCSTFVGLDPAHPPAWIPSELRALISSTKERGRNAHQTHLSVSQGHHPGLPGLGTRGDIGVPARQ